MKSRKRFWNGKCRIRRQREYNVRWGILNKHDGRRMSYEHWSGQLGRGRNPSVFKKRQNPEENYHNNNSDNKYTFHGVTSHLLPICKQHIVVPTQEGTEYGKMLFISGLLPI